MPAIMATGLDAIMSALGAEGIALIRGASDSAGEEPEVLHRAGTVGLLATSVSMLLWRAELGVPALAQEPNGRPVAVAICRQSKSEKIGLVLWRRRGARAWSGEDVSLIDSLAGVAWLMLDRDGGQRDLRRSSRTDPVTALLSQRSFVAEATRHIARLDRDNIPGTLMLAEVDNLEAVSSEQGSDGVDRTLRRAAILLQSAVRPTDLLGRTGDAEFAAWLSGADHMTAAERAEALCLEAPGKDGTPGQILVPEISFSIGIATRTPGEGFAQLARRASQAMREVKVEGGGYWRVSLVKTD